MAGAAVGLTAGAIHPVYAQQAAGAVFTLAPKDFGLRTAADVPVVLIHLHNFARRVRVDVLRPGQRHSLGEALRRDYVPRNIVENLLAQPWGLVTALPFDGTVRRGDRQLRLPDGDYQLVVTVERPLATDDTPVESWTSPVFGSIARTRRPAARGSARPGARSPTGCAS